MHFKINATIPDNAFIPSRRRSSQEVLASPSNAITPYADGIILANATYELMTSELSPAQNAEIIALATVDAADVKIRQWQADHPDEELTDEQQQDIIDQLSDVDVQNELDKMQMENVKLHQRIATTYEDDSNTVREASVDTLDYAKAVTAYTMDVSEDYVKVKAKKAGEDIEVTCDNVNQSIQDAETEFSATCAGLLAIAQNTADQLTMQATAAYAQGSEQAASTLANVRAAVGAQDTPVAKLKALFSTLGISGSFEEGVDLSQVSCQAQGIQGERLGAMCLNGLTAMADGWSWESVWEGYKKAMYWSSGVGVFKWCWDKLTSTSASVPDWAKEVAMVKEFEVADTKDAPYVAAWYPLLLNVPTQETIDWCTKRIGKLFKISMSSRCIYLLVPPTFLDNHQVIWFIPGLYMTPQYVIRDGETRLVTLNDKFGYVGGRGGETFNFDQSLFSDALTAACADIPANDAVCVNGIKTANAAFMNEIVTYAEYAVRHVGATPINSPFWWDMYHSETWVTDWADGQLGANNKAILDEAQFRSLRNYPDEAMPTVEVGSTTFKVQPQDRTDTLAYLIERMDGSSDNFENGVFRPVIFSGLSGVLMAMADKASFIPYMTVSELDSARITIKSDKQVVAAPLIAGAAVAAIALGVVVGIKVAPKLLKFHQQLKKRALAFNEKTRIIEKRANRGTLTGEEMKAYRKERRTLNFFGKLKSASGSVPGAMSSFALPASTDVATEDSSRVEFVETFKLISGRLPQS